MYAEVPIKCSEITGISQVQAPVALSLAMSAPAAVVTTLDFTATAGAVILSTSLIAEASRPAPPNRGFSDISQYSCTLQNEYLPASMSTRGSYLADQARV
jgi:hypothetical protein